jgi:hypothetical protein
VDDWSGAGFVPVGDWSGAGFVPVADLWPQVYSECCERGLFPITSLLT